MGDNIEQSNSSANENKRNDETKKKLFNKAMKGQWKEVIDIYRENPWIHQVKITRSGATALHIAVFNGEGEIVKMLVDIIRECRTFDALKMKDELGNTPLHNAALLGKVNMCRCIATVKPSLIGIRNLDNETPFFVSVLHGHKNAFLSLHYLCEDNGGRYCRGNHGNTILHAAISGDYYGNLLLSFYRDNLTNMWCSERKHIFIVPDLAFQIIYLYSELVNSVNELGLSPLHLLAGKPSAFRSGSHLRRWDLFIYHCKLIDLCVGFCLIKINVLKSIGLFLLRGRYIC